MDSIQRNYPSAIARMDNCALESLVKRSLIAGTTASTALAELRRRADGHGPTQWVDPVPGYDRDGLRDLTYASRGL